MEWFFIFKERESGLIYEFIILNFQNNVGIFKRTNE